MMFGENINAAGFFTNWNPSAGSMTRETAIFLAVAVSAVFILLGIAAYLAFSEW
jgi:hypothetical protein